MGSFQSLMQARTEPSTPQYKCIKMFKVSPRFLRHKVYIQYRHVPRGRREQDSLEESRLGSPLASTSPNENVATTGGDFETSRPAKQASKLSSSLLVNTTFDCTSIAQTAGDIKDCAYSEVWTPPSSQNSEVSVSKDGRRHTFQPHCLQPYKQLAFYDVKNGAFCNVCIFFLHEKALT